MQFELVAKHLEQRVVSLNLECAILSVYSQGNLLLQSLLASCRIVGGAFFQNSFGQPSEYLYVGKMYWVPRTSETVYAKVTGGLIYGYKDEYQDQIPLNKYGVAPAILPAIGFQARTLGGELVVFGTAGAMVTLGFKF